MQIEFFNFTKKETVMYLNSTIFLHIVLVYLLTLFFKMKFCKSCLMNFRFTKVATNVELEYLLNVFVCKRIALTKYI